MATESTNRRADEATRQVTMTREQFATALSESEELGKRVERERLLDRLREPDEAMVEAVLSPYWPLKLTPDPWAELARQACRALAAELAKTKE